MAADKRKVSTDALETLGMIIGPDEKRDAIHLAVEPVVAGEDLRPGEPVLLTDGIAFSTRRYRPDRPVNEPVGIVDPFIEGRVGKGDRFWLVVYPRQITSLRHVWTHPAFPEADVPGPAAAPTPKEQRRRESELWLRRFISTHDCPSYETLINAATGRHELNRVPGKYHESWNKEGVLHFTGYDAHGEIPPEFWDHVSIVAGRTIPQSERAQEFSCSC